MAVRRVAWLIMLVALVACSEDGSVASDALTNDEKGRQAVIAYPVQWANQLHNGRVPTVVAAKGVRAWATAFASIDEEAGIAVEAVLISGSNLVMRGGTAAFVFDLRGDYQRRHPILQRGPVVLTETSIATIRPAFMLEVHDFNGTAQLENKSVSGLREWTRVLAFHLDDDEMWSVLQFTGGPHREALPKEWSIARQAFDQNLATWSHEDTGVIDNAVFVGDLSQLAISRDGILEFIELDTGSRSEPIQLDVTRIETMSSRDDGSLVARAIDSDGQQILLELEPDGSERSRQSMNAPPSLQPPVLGSDGRIVFVDAGMLRCRRGDEDLWSAGIDSSVVVWLTLDAENNVVVIHGGDLSVYEPDGAHRFTTRISDVGENFRAPAAIGDDGRIYLSGDQALYCFH